MYKIIQDNGQKKSVLATFDTFKEAKDGLFDQYNTSMFGGIICTWKNNISYCGQQHGEKFTTYIKKSQ